MGKYKKVTAYNKQSKSQKEFDDESLITDEYTLKTPTTQFDEWNNGDWIANKELTLTHELKILDVNFNKDVKLLTDSMAIAMLEDTSNDQSEMSKLKARYATRKEQYEFDKIELIKKFELE
ncbi:tail fiber assembly [Vibrio phage K121]